MKAKYILLFLFLCFSAELFSQIELKKPSGAVGIKIVDSIVEKSFNMYDILFDYHQRTNEGEVLCDEDISQLEEILSESEKIIRDALAAKEVLRKEKLLTRTKGTIHLERAKRALYYCKETSNKLLLAQNSSIENQ